MTKKELIDNLKPYADDCEVMVVGDTPDIHYEIGNVDYGYDEDLEKDVILLYN